jgi:hypothetical protein
MGKIYRNATRVLVWLGLPTMQSDQTFELLKELTQNLKRSPQEEKAHCAEFLQHVKRLSGITQEI